MVFEHRAKKKVYAKKLTDIYFRSTADSIRLGFGGNFKIHPSTPIIAQSNEKREREVKASIGCPTTINTPDRIRFSPTTQ